MPSCSPFQNDPEADLTIQCADGTQLHLRRKYLSLNTGAFPGAEFSTNGEITHLTEPSSILEILFQFVYPSRHPDLDGRPFRVVAALAEAAEKYEVFAAMNVCRMRMRQFLPENAKDILEYASKHDYPPLIEEAASHLVLLPMADVAQCLPTRYLAAWMRFHTARRQIFDDITKAISELRPTKPNCARTQSYMGGAAPLQACHACLFSLLITIRELYEIQDQKELDEALIKPRHIQTTCLAPQVCQYAFILKEYCNTISAKTKQLPSLSKYM